MFNGNGNGHNLYGQMQSNSYNESEVHRLSKIDSGEDPIAQAMGLQQPTEPIYQVQKQNNYYQQSHPQIHSQNNQITVNGKTISIAISPDGTITITIN